MPFEISVSINSQVVVHIKGRNCGPPFGLREQPTRIYRYKATHPEFGKTTDGEVLHIRSDGIERLTAIIFDDLAKHQQNSRGLLSNEKRLGELRRLIQEGIDSENIEFDFEQLKQELDRKPGRFKGQLGISDDFDDPVADAYVGRVLDAIERNLCDELLTRHTFAADLARIGVLCGLIGCDALAVGNATARRLIAFEAVFQSLHLGPVAGDNSLSIARDWLAAHAVEASRLCRALHGGGRAEDLAAILSPEQESED